MAEKKDNKNAQSNDYIQELLSKLKESINNYDEEQKTAAEETSDDIKVNISELDLDDFVSTDEESEESAPPASLDEEDDDEDQIADDDNHDEPEFKEEDKEDGGEEKSSEQPLAEERVSQSVSAVDAKLEDDDIILSDNMQQLALPIEEGIVQEKEGSNISSFIKLADEPFNDEKTEQTSDEKNNDSSPEQEEYDLVDDLPWELAKKESDEGYELPELDTDDTVDINTLVIPSVARKNIRKYHLLLISRRPEKIAPIEILPKLESSAECELDANDENEIVAEKTSDDVAYSDVLNMVNHHSDKGKKHSDEKKTVDTILQDEDDAPTAAFVFSGGKRDDDESTKIIPSVDEKTDFAVADSDDEDFPEFDEDLDSPKNPPLTDDISEYSINAFSDDYDAFSGTKNYNYPNEISRIKAEYKKNMLVSRIKMISIAVAALFLLILENAALFRIPLPQLLHIEANPAIYALIDLQLLVIAVALSYLEMFRGARSVAGKKITPESFCLVACALALLHTLCLCVSNRFGNMYGFAACIVLLACHVGKYIELCGERDTYECYSSQGDKLVADIIKNQDVSDALKQKYDDPSLKVMRIKKVGYVNGFLDRTEKKGNDDKLNMILLVASLSFSLIMGVVAIIISKDASFLLFISTVTSSLMFSVSFSVFFSHVLPVYILEKNATEKNCAIVGETSLDEYTSTGFVSFEDVEAFPTRKAKIKGIKIFGDDRPDDILYNMSGLFATVGGPLDGIFRVSVSDLGMPSDVKLLSVSSNGLRAVIEGREFLVGRGDYMERNGVTLFYDSDDEAQIEHGNVSIMFLAEAGELRAKFYVEYNVSSRFLANVKRLKKNGIRSVIRSYDPNIDEKLFEKLSGVDLDTVTVVKKKPENVNDFAQLCVNSGLVTGESSKDIVRMIFACFEAKKAIWAGKIVKIATTVTGMLAALACTAIGVSFPSVTMVLVSLLLLVPLALAVRLIMKKQ